jgi:hypothetical protein
MLDMHSAGPTRYTVYEHSAGSALPHSTTEFRSGEIKVIPENPEQGFIGLSLHPALFPVDMQREPGLRQITYSRRLTPKSPFLLTHESFPVNHDDKHLFNLTY